MALSKNSIRKQALNVLNTMRTEQPYLDWIEESMRRCVNFSITGCSSGCNKGAVIRLKRAVICLGNCSFIILIHFLFFSTFVLAAELEDFAGGVSNTRATINPASIGLIDRFHLEYVAGGNWYGKESSTNKELSSFASQFELNGADAVPLAPDGETRVSGIRYSKARIGILHFVFVWPLEDFSIGMGIDDYREIYKDADFLDFDGNPLNEVNNQTSSLTEKLDWNTWSYMVGMTLPGFSFGVRYNSHNFDHDISAFNAAALVPISDSNSTVDFRGKIDIVGNASYNSLDYGILIPNLIPKMDIGITYRAPTTATIRFDTEKLKNLPAGASYKKATFQEPSLLLFGVGYIFEFEGTALQLLGDYGKYSEVENNAAGESGTDGNRAGALTRFVWPPLIDISYGIQEEQLAGFKLQKISASLQFPLPALEGYNLKLGTQTFKVTDSGGSTVLDVTFTTFSMNIQWGERRGRALEVPPKTKEIRFIDRL
ncbi:MAG: hypothetical protein HQM14_13255 [SAR324 cluster bacterium]|nr:hypothetical protein [SAR324 cluster bacterium]